MSKELEPTTLEEALVLIRNLRDENTRQAAELKQAERVVADLMGNNRSGPIPGLRSRSIDLSKAF